MSHYPVPQGSLDTYLVEINRFPLLTPKEEFNLAVHYQEEGDVEAAHKLVTANLRFVVKIAYEYSSYGIRMADLIQEGNIGLMTAVKKFDPHKGFRLISYAVWWIRAMIQNFILKSWSLVKIGTTQAQRKLFKSGLAKRDQSLDQAAFGDAEDGPTNLDLLASPEDQEKLLTDTEEGVRVRSEVQKALTTLSDKERFIVEKRLMADEPMTLQEIGDRYRISRERARQIEEKAKKKIKVLLTEASLASPAPFAPFEGDAI